jgi:hypothetical protein
MNTNSLLAVVMGRSPSPSKKKYERLGFPRVGQVGFK